MCLFMYVCAQETGRSNEMEGSSTKSKVEVVPPQPPTMDDKCVCTTASLSSATTTTTTAAAADVPFERDPISEYLTSYRSTSTTAATTNTPPGQRKTS